MRVTPPKPRIALRFIAPEDVAKRTVLASPGRALRFLVVTSAISVLTWRGVALWSAWSDWSAKPRLAVDSLQYDFGEIHQGSKLDHQFQLTNRGGTPLFVRQVAPCCGLTVSLLGPPRVAPGETRAVEVSSPVLVTPGIGDTAIHLETNDPRRKYISLRLTWSIVARMTAVPGQIDFGELPQGETASRTVDLWYVPQESRVLSLEVMPAALRAEFVPLADDAAYRRLRLQLNSAALAPGELTGEVRLRWTDLPSSPMRVPVCATILGTVAVRPEALFLGFVSPRPPLTPHADVTIWSRRSEPVHLTRQPVGPYRATLQPQRARGEYRLAVAATGKLRAGRISDRVELRIGDRRIQVPLAGYVDTALN